MTEVGDRDKRPIYCRYRREDSQQVSASVLFPMGMLSMRVDNTYRYVVPFVTNHVHKLLY